MKPLLSTSRQSAFLSCPRRHYWRHEVKLRREVDSMALRLGSAWASALEARWKCEDSEACLMSAAENFNSFDELTAETFTSLWAGYFQQYNSGANDPDVESIIPELEYEGNLPGSRLWRIGGKIDGLARLRDGRIAIIESKTTSQSIAPDSEYWQRLRFNPQLLEYATAARQLGYDVSVALYDVTSKPSIRPRQVPVLDEQGLKVVKDTSGQRVFLDNGKPRQAGDTKQGWTLETREETPEEFGLRLFNDICERPAFYYARREVPILDDDLAEYAGQRKSVADMITACRHRQEERADPTTAWPRNIGDACKFCDYASFCLQNIKPDLSNPPAGFRVGYLK